MTVLKALATKGWDVNEKLSAEDGLQTPLQIAFYNDKKDALYFLLDKGAKITNELFIDACEYGDDPALVKRLIELGADIGYEDKYGERAYHYALRNEQVAEYIKSVEPPAWHDDGERLKKLKSYKLPKGLITLLRSNDRRVLLPGCEYTGFIEFASLGDVREAKWKNKKFLALLIDADRYGADGFLVWHPSSKILASADYEHGVFTPLCSFEEFIANPSAAINKIFE